MNITGKTKVFGVIADPIEHVRAPEVFNPIFEKHGIDAVMVPFHVKPEYLEKTVRGLSLMPNVGGVCVTNPYKSDVFSLCDQDEAYSANLDIIDTVNVLRFEDYGKIIGENFDGWGFVGGLEKQGHDIEGKNILIIGAGGAARAIALTLVFGSAKCLTIANRTIEMARMVNNNIYDRYIHIVGDEDPTKIVVHPIGDIADIIGKQDIIINTTTLGLNESDAFPCSLDGVKPDVLIADIIMKPAITRWLKHAQEKGLKIHQGRHMFDDQIYAIGNFLRMWNPDTIKEEDLL